MGSGSKRCMWWMVQLVVAATYYMRNGVEGEPQVPCFFIFGDSLSDPGNNNNLPTMAKSNYPPYGIDFLRGATGRFTNNFTVPDYLTKYMGMENLIPPFANTSGSDILKGVNYASGAAGIRIETGTQMGADISMNLQIANHKITVAAIIGKIGSVEAAKEYLNKCLYYVNVGSNDFINNYFQPQYYPSSHIYNVDQYADVLIRQYSLQLQSLYELGARKLAVVGVGLIGCAPAEIARHGTDEVCVPEENTAASIFNTKLRLLVHQLNSNFSAHNASFIFVDSTAIFTLNPLFLGLNVTNAPCCPTVSSTGLCVANDTPCQNRNDYVFWDGYHPTDAVNKITAMSAYNASNAAFTYPMDINHLLSS